MQGSSQGTDTTRHTQETGECVALDGWRMAWNLGTTPQQLDVWNADGVPQYTISGTIDERKLEREIRQFTFEHAFVQGRLVALWPLIQQVEEMADGH